MTTSSRDSHVMHALPPLASRLAVGRPVMSREQLLALAHRISQMTTLDNVTIRVTHTVNIITRLASDHVLTSDDGDLLDVQFTTSAPADPPVLQLFTNQLDDSTLLTGVQRLETILRSLYDYNPTPWAKHEVRFQDHLIPTKLWHDATVDAMTSTRATVIPELLDRVTKAGLTGAGFLGFMARAEAYVDKRDGLVAFNEETDSEITITARTPDLKRSGWGGVTGRDWSTVKYMDAADQAVSMATLCPGAPVAVEPGRRTAILSPSATAALLRTLAEQFEAFSSNWGQTALSTGMPGTWGSKLHQRIFDPRLKMSSDPADPEGGFRPYFGDGFATRPMTWVENGVLTNLAYNDVNYANDRGMPYSDRPNSVRLSGGETTVEQMIATCAEGIYVNRLSDLRTVHYRSGLVSGVTRDGCFLIKDGKLSKPIKNFRILESPFFVLNNVIALGTPRRAAIGYVRDAFWPLEPIIAPPIMVRDFNFSSLADAV